MSDMINLTDVESNQILVWSEIEQAFINITPSQALLNIESVSHQPLSPNANVVHSIDNNILRTKGIVGGDNVTITETNSDIIINVEVETSDDALTLAGYSHLAFVKKSELNSLIDLTMIQDSMDVYSKSESHEQFMETNASNIPDADNAYDLGSNGRRYSDVYAKTFHGTATNALFAQSIARNGATENDVMTWVGNSWVPRPSGSVPLANLNDVNLFNLKDSQILTYDLDNAEWKNVKITDIFSGVTLQFANTGHGEEIYTNTIGDTVRLKTLEANDGIILSSDENSIHIELDMDYIDSMVDDKLRIVDVSTLENIFDITEVNDNTMLVWDDGRIVNRPIPVGGGDGSIDTSNADAGQVLGFDGTNLIFVDQYDSLADIDTSNAIDGYYIAFNGSGYELREITDNDSLSSVDTTNANNGDILLWDGSQYTLAKVTTFDNIDVGSASDGFIITYQGGEFILSEPVDVGLTLTDLDDVGASDGYYVAFNGTSYELRELPEGGSTIDSDTLGDVSTVGANNGDLLVWNGSEYELRDIKTLEEVDVSSAVDGYVLTYNGGDFILSENTISDTLSQLDTTSAQDGYYVAFNGTGYELREIPFSGIDSDTLGDVDTTSASNGDVLVWNGTNYVLQDITTLDDINLTDVSDGDVLIFDGTGFSLTTISTSDTLGDVVTSAAQDGYYVAFNGSGYELREIPANSSDSDTLGDVDTSTASNGDVLVWNGTNYTLQDITTLDDIETGTATSGSLLSWNGTSFELTSVTFTDTLGDVDTSTASNGDVLSWNNGSYELSTLSMVDTLSELSDVNISNPLADQVLTWNGTEFTLQTFTGSGGATTLTQLDDVDETVSPNDGEVLTYNTTKSQYEPKPLPFSTGGGTKYEILKVNYTVNGNFGTAEYLSDNITVSNVINSDTSLLEITFSNYTFPPISIGYWGYVYNHNFYRYIAITEASSEMTVGGLGESGAPLVFDPNRTDKEFKMNVSARIGETKASASSGFPPEPTHAYIVFVMGE